MGGTEERALIARVLEGDRLAARELYDAYLIPVYRSIYRIVRDEVLAEEYTQDAFVRVFGALPTFRGESKLGTWIHSVAVSVALGGLRRRKRWTTRETDLDLATDVAATEDRLEPDLREELHKAIDALPEPFRIVVVLHDIEGFTHAEIAQMTGSPEGTCKTRLMGARAKLRQALSAFAR
jgi:RNA polymerase sigma-70 factor (ECF subfamily)